MSTTAISQQVAVVGGGNACIYWPRGCAAPG
jgi:hypothetical protein